MRFDPIELGGWVSLLIFVLGSILGFAVVAFRSRRGPVEWGLLDALVLLLSWIWVTTGLSLLALRLGTGSFAEPESLPLPLAMAAMAVGGTLTVVLVFLRCRPAGLGLGPVSLRWLLLALLLEGPVLALSVGWSLLLEALGIELQSQEVLVLLASQRTVGVVVLVAIYGGVVAPIIEELLFRGVLFVPSARLVGGGLTVVGTALIFGLLHLADPQAVPPLILLGLGLGWLRLASGSMWPPLVLHIFNNLIALGATLGGLEL